MTDSRQEHLNQVFERGSQRFGLEPSYAATPAVRAFQREGVLTVLELGAGTGRDTLYLAANGFAVTAVDYAASAVSALVQSAQMRRLEEKITAKEHDVRVRLPFADATFDACFSHMLFCMALSDKDLTFLADEVLRILKTGGVVIYSARNTDDRIGGSAYSTLTTFSRRKVLWCTFSTAAPLNG